MSKAWSPFAAVAVAVVIWVAGAAIVDWLVLQLYPLPPGLWETASMREIIASRPDAAVALNIAGDTLILAAVAFLASRVTTWRPASIRRVSPRAGIWVTAVIGVLVVVNAVAMSHFRWIHAVGLPLFQLAGIVGAKRGASAP